MTDAEAEVIARTLGFEIFERVRLVKCPDKNNVPQVFIVALLQGMMRPLVLYAKTFDLSKESLLRGIAQEWDELEQKDIH